MIRRKMNKNLIPNEFKNKYWVKAGYCNGEIDAEKAVEEEWPTLYESRKEVIDNFDDIKKSEDFPMLLDIFIQKLPNKHFSIIIFPLTSETIQRILSKNN